jgi:hypothetical protein
MASEVDPPLGERRLSAVPKPLGFEFRDRRAFQTNNADAWLPADALYDAYRDMEADGVVHAMVVAWYAVDETGAQRLRFRLAHARENDGRALLVDLFKRAMDR